MGREIRMVPPDWEHPRGQDSYGRTQLKPMYDQNFEDASSEWLEEFDRIRAGKMTDFEREWYPLGVCEWATENVAPNPEYYRPWRDEEASWYQLWQTVSEGTPVTPPFETQQGLIEYLAEHGDFWDQERCKKPEWQTLYGGVPGVSGWGAKRAERFVKGDGFAPSLVVENGKAISGVEFVTRDSQ